MSVEVNFDGLIGPTHNYGGLSLGNIASAKHNQQTSYPKQAALQGLAKMRLLIEAGYQQGFLLPQWRPDLSILHNMGFRGTDKQLINQAARQAPDLLALVYSASSMWAANAATVTPSADSHDGKVHFTPANLVSTTHRAIEHKQTARCLKQIFSDQANFCIHDALIGTDHFGDEGAANHNRFCEHYGSSGMAMFVYGSKTSEHPGPKRFPARQTYLASQAVARQHGVLDRAVFVQQNPEAIDAGAFHNDVVAVANGPVLFLHEQAFVLDSFKPAAETLLENIDFKPVMVRSADVSLADAISTYLFNSQLLAAADGDLDNMCLIAPRECAENIRVANYLKQLIREASNPINEVIYVDVRQSMSNGGGPACLRLRVVLNAEELAAMDQRFLLNLSAIDKLETWVAKYYSDTLNPDELRDPALMERSFEALEALAQLLKLGQYYTATD